MAYEIQYAKIATTGKLSDRFLNCQTRSSNDLNKAFMGQVYTLVEIISPWFATTQVGQAIINTFSQSYYQGGSTSDLVNFEEALKKVNEALAQITQNGETNWIGNLNAVLAVVVENKLHIAQTGKAEAFIFREGKIENITQGLAQNQLEPHPLKTFSNITSGELKTHDKILFANPELFKNLDIEAIRQIITISSSNEAVLQIAKILKRKKVKNVNLLILDLMTDEEMSSMAVSNLPNVVYLDRPIESFGVWAIKLWHQILRPLLKIIGEGTKDASKKSLDFTKKYLTLLKNRSSQELPRKKDFFEKEFLSDTQADEGLLKDEEIKYSPELQVHYYERHRQFKKGWWLKTWHWLIALFKNIFGLLKNCVRDRKKRPYFLVVVAILILAVVFFTILNNKTTNKQQGVNLLEAQTILKEAETANKEAKSAILYKDTNKAKKLLAESIEKAKKISSIEIVKKNAREVLENSYAELDKLTATTRFKELRPIISTGKETKAVFVFSGQVYFVTNSEIFKSTLLGGNLEKIATFPRNNGNFVSGALGNKNIYLYTSSQKVYELSITTDKLDVAKIGDAKWETANSSFFYIGNLYLLDGVIGQIYKHASSEGIFQKGEGYIQSAAVNAKNGVSLAIDGFVYVLKNNGEVLKLQRGKLQDFSLSDIPSPWSKIEKPLKLYTDSDTPSIYILDGGRQRILEFDKDGHFTHQYALPDNLIDIKDFIVSSKAKKIWILNSGDLYEIGI